MNENSSMEKVEEFVEIEYAIISTKWFIKNFPELYKSMVTTEHGYRGEEENPYHLEGSVWEHAMRVVEEFLKDLPENNRMVFFWTALLHDIGKCFVFEDNDEKRRRRFFNHEAMSTYLAKPILEKAGFEKEDREKILKLIALHTEFHKLTKENLEDFVRRYGVETSYLSWIFSKYDSKGRIVKEGFEIKTYEFSLQDFLMAEKPINNSGKNSTIVLMIGPPGSGKSTYSRKYYNDFFIISRDELVEKYGRGKNYKEKWNSLTTKEQSNIDKELMSVFKSAIQRKENIVIDMTNMNRKARRKWLKGFNLDGYMKKGVVFIEDPEILKLRRRSEEKEIEGSVIDGMVRSFAFPDYNEFDEIEVIC